MTDPIFSLFFPLVFARHIGMLQQTSVTFRGDRIYRTLGQTFHGLAHTYDSSTLYY